MPCGPDVRLRELAVLTEGYTGADIKLVCREAAISALEVIIAYNFIYNFILFLYICPRLCV
jgi:SpoVK/Ycf46/Vps4 family AAA+-type ATPase